MDFHLLDYTRFRFDFGLHLLRLNCDKRDKLRVASEKNFLLEKKVFQCEDSVI